MNGIAICVWKPQHSRIALNADFQERLVTLKAEISRRITQLQEAARTARLYEDELLKLANQSVEISRTRYESGEGTLLAWIDSERSLLELELNYWEAISNIAKHHLSLQVIINQPIAGIQISETNE